MRRSRRVVVSSVLGGHRVADLRPAGEGVGHLHPNEAGGGNVGLEGHVVETVLLAHGGVGVAVTFGVGQGVFSGEVVPADDAIVEEAKLPNEGLDDGVMGKRPDKGVVLFVGHGGIIRQGKRTYRLSGRVRGR